MSTLALVLRIGGAFVLGGALGGLATAVANVSLGNVDPKYQNAPSLALAIELAEAAILAVIGGAFFTGALWWRTRSAGLRDPGWMPALLAGAAFPVVLQLLRSLLSESLDPESMAALVAVVAVLLAYPLASALLLPQSGRGTKSTT